MTVHQFTRNFSDHSNDQGYQFEFFCDKCGNGYRSSFKTSKIGMVGSLLRAAGSIFGGAVASAGWGAHHLKDALRGPAWDSAYSEAVAEIKPKFCQCTRCGRWVCPEICWNEKRALCEDCAPDLQEAAAHIQAQVAVEQMWERARQADQTQGQNLSSPQLAACPHCNARLEPNARFCSSCGKSAGQPQKTFCHHCGQPRQEGSRFCPSCGTPA